MRINACTDYWLHQFCSQRCIAKVSKWSSRAGATGVLHWLLWVPIIESFLNVVEESLGMPTSSSLIDTSFTQTQLLKEDLQVLFPHQPNQFGSLTSVGQWRTKVSWIGRPMMRANIWLNISWVSNIKIYVNRRRMVRMFCSLRGSRIWWWTGTCCFIGGWTECRPCRCRLMASSRGDTMLMARSYLITMSKDCTIIIPRIWRGWLARVRSWWTVTASQGTGKSCWRKCRSMMTSRARLSSDDNRTARRWSRSASSMKRKSWCWCWLTTGKVRWQFTLQKVPMGRKVQLQQLSIDLLCLLQSKMNKDGVPKALFIHQMLHDQRRNVPVCRATTHFHSLGAQVGPADLEAFRKHNDNIGTKFQGALCPGFDIPLVFLLTFKIQFDCNIYAWQTPHDVSKVTQNFSKTAITFIFID